MCLLGILRRPGVSWGVLGCPGVIRLTGQEVTRMKSRAFPSIYCLLAFFKVYLVIFHSYGQRFLIKILVMRTKQPTKSLYHISYGG